MVIVPTVLYSIFTLREYEINIGRLWFIILIRFIQLITNVSFIYNSSCSFRREINYSLSDTVLYVRHYQVLRIINMRIILLLETYVYLSQKIYVKYLLLHIHTLQ